MSLVRGALVGVVAGALAGLFGIGGGILIVPALVLLMHVDQRLAHGISLAATLPLAASGTVGFATGGSVDWAVAGLLALGAVAGAFLGTGALRRWSTGALRVTFAVALALAAVRMIIEVADGAGRADLTAGSVVALVVTGVLSGTVAGLLGVGGGIVLVPVQVIVFGIPQALAKGTSLAVIVPTSLAGTLRNLRHGNTDLRMAGAVGLAGTVSSYLAAKVSIGLDPRTSSYLFAALLVLAAVRLIVRHVRRRGSGPAPAPRPVTELVNEESNGG